MDIPSISKMKKNKLLFLNAFILSIICVYSQSDEKQIDDNLLSLNSENAELNLINNQILQINHQDELQFRGNNVNITQVGSRNFARVVVFSENSELIMQQHGASNNAILDLKGTSIDYSLAQKGTYNFMAEYSRSSNIEISRSLMQNGDRNNVVIHGANSLTKDLKLNIQGNSKTVIIRNFN